MDRLRYFTIIRSPSMEDGTFGMMLDGATPFCLTLEKSWAENEVEKSCIPDEEYICRRINSPKFGNTFEICDVPNRTHILFHKANLVIDLLGCIGLGEEFGILDGKTAILASGRAFQEFIERTKDINNFKLFIFWAL